MYKEIIKKIAPIFDLSEAEMEKYFVETPRSEFGDYTLTILMQPEYKDNKDAFFDKIKEALKIELISEVKLQGLFVNIFINPIFVLNNPKKLDSENLKVLFEYPSPNANKPLHIGHLRNIVLGDALSTMFELKYKVKRMNLINDRGIAMSKTMLGYQMCGYNSPEDANKKSDHFVGDCYVYFNTKLKDDESLLDLAQQSLQKWEAGDKQTIDLWKKIMLWVESGQEITYKRLKMKDPDYTIYEHDIYKNGKEIVLDAYKRGVVTKDEKGNYVINLEKYDLPLKSPYKVVLRGDETGVYLTQDIYLTKYKLEELDSDLIIHVSGSEQLDYFKPLFCIAKELFGQDKGLEHFSYGMISLPSGKIKSREGNTADIDAILDYVSQYAESILREKWPDIDSKELNYRKEVIALAAVKYFILSYDPKKDFMFNRETSLSFDGNSGPYVLYTLARINSLIKKISENAPAKQKLSKLYTSDEIKVARLIAKKNFRLELAIKKRAPHLIVSYLAEIANEFNSLYANTKMITTSEEIKERIIFLQSVKNTIVELLDILNIPYLEQM